jgi:hypothetical protein
VAGQTKNNMTEIKKITEKIIALAVDICLFGFNTTRQVVLPNKKRKGTILTSLFVFFTGVLDRVESFEHGAFKMTKILRHKYLKQILFVVTGLLFLLSAHEQEAAKNFSFYTDTSIERNPDAAVVKINSVKQQPILSSSESTCLNRPFTYCPKVTTTTLLLPTKKTYLRFHNLRI